MPAKARCRINEAGIYSHIYNKGIEKRVIFNDEDDYQVFVGYLEDYLTSPKDPESVKKTFKIKGRTYRGTPHQPKNYFNDVELIAYSLKSDHFHLVLHQKTPGALGKFIRSLCTRYSMYFNKKYQHSGTLFEGPYKSIAGGNQNFLPYLSRHLHHTGGYSSYLEYLGKRSTAWVKPQVILSLFKMNPDGYKYFMEEKKYNQKENDFIDAITFAGDTECLEGRDLASPEEIYLNSGKKSAPKVLTFWGTSIVVFLLLINLSARNIQGAINLNQYLPIPVQSEPISQVLGIGKVEPTEVLSLEPTPEATPQMPEEAVKLILTVKTPDGSSSVNIRQEPSTDSAKLSKARDGDTFEFVSQDSGWYEVKLPDGSTGFITAKYIIEEVNN